MKKRGLLPFLPLLTCLCFSCTSKSNSAHPDFSLFPFSDGEGLGHLARNGENYKREGIAYPYEDVCRKGDADLIKERINDGESVLIFLHQDSCPSCQRAHDDLVSFFLDSGVELFSFYFQPETHSATFAELTKITAAFPSYTEVMHDYITPSIFLLKNPEKAYYLNFLPERTSLQNLEEYFKTMLDFSLVFHFRTYASFQSFVHENDCLAYVDDGSSELYQKHVYPKAIHTPKKVARVESSFFSDEDKAALNNLLGNDDTALFTNGKVTEKESGSRSPEAAISLIDRYFA